MTLNKQQRQDIDKLFLQSIKTIDEILNDPKASPSVRLRAALAVLKMAAMPDAPQSEEDGEASTATTAQLEQPGKIATLRLTAGPGRNTICPCGSGLKFKRCCSQNASQSELLTGT